MRSLNDGLMNDGMSCTALCADSKDQYRYFNVL